MMTGGKKMKDKPKRYLIALFTALFVTTKRVIPAKAGIQKHTPACR
jgi:hypothetical protein